MPLKKDIKLVRSLQQKKFRNELNLFVVEGKKMVEEALQSSFILHSLYTTDNAFHHELAIEVNNKEMEMMSSLTTASPYLVVLQKKDNPLPETKVLKDTVLVLDGIADPGNMGTILRTAEWFGIEHVFCSDDCVELYNPKTVQSTMGSLFRTNAYYHPVKELMDYLKSNDYRISGADMNGTYIYDHTFQTKEAIVIGSESHGLRSQMRECIDSYITIPTKGKAESLNASIATAIIVAEITRRKH